MNVHQNARLTPQGRAQMVQRVEGGERVRAVARAVGVTDRTVRKWVTRWRAAPRAPITAPAPRLPASSPRSSPCASSAGRALRSPRGWASVAPPSAACCGRVAWHGCGPWSPGRRASSTSAPSPASCCTSIPRNSAGSCGPGIGSWGPDGVSRAAPAGSTPTSASMTPRALAYVEILPDERSGTAQGFLRRAVRWLAALGVPVQRVMTDNGSPYIAHAFDALCQRLGVRQLRTRPFTPRTNGKAERFIQTMVRQWAYGRVYPNSAQRRARLPAWLHYYNVHRGHTSLAGRPRSAVY
jgi:transposase InsO family protein